MYLGVALVAAIILAVASPLIWVGWWLLADLSETAAGGQSKSFVPSRRHVPAA